MKSKIYKGIAAILIILLAEGISEIHAQQAAKMPQRMSLAMSAIAKKPIPGKGGDNSTVGWIDYEESVSDKGARIYNVPLRTSPLSKFAPEISLRYDSQGGNGIAGYGWEIGGLSQITIIPKTLYWHHEIKGADVNDPSAAYALDGVPIMACSDPSLAGEYPLETISGNIVLRKHDIGGIVTHFTALYPDGTKAVFGDPNPENIAPTGIFRISRKEDRNGNIIEYEYDGITPGSKLTAVNYRHRDNKENIGSLTFEYEVRSDSYDRYYALQNLSCESLLKTITSNSGKRALCHYSLTHEMAEGVNLLTEIKCIAHNGDEVRPLTFSYGQSTDAEYFRNEEFHQIVSKNFGQNTQEAEERRYIRGRFSRGDASDGLIILPVKSTYAVISDNFWGKNHQYGSTYPPETLIQILPSLDYEYPALPTITAGPDFQWVEAVDVDNDGLDEVVKINFKGASSETGMTTLAVSIYKYGHVSKIMEQAGSFDVPVAGAVVEGRLVSPMNRKFFFGDFDGLGRIQMATISFANDLRNNFKESQIALIDLKDGKKISEGPLFNLLTEDDKMIICLDIDGDGKAELCHANENGLDVYNSDGKAFSLTRSQSGISSILFQDDIHFTDVNGDGYIDIVRNQLSWDELLIYRNVQDSFMMDFINVSERKEEDALHFADVNRDGLPDMLFRKDSTLYVYPNVFGSFPESERITSTLDISGKMVFLPCRPGTPESGEMIIVDRGNASRHRFSTSKPLRLMLTTFVNSLGKVSFNRYEDFSTNMFTMPLLSESRSYLNMTCSPADCIENISYEYHDVYTDKRGMDFKGFKRVVTKDCRGGDAVEEIIERTLDQEMNGVVTKCSKTIAGASEPYEVTDYTYALAKRNPQLTDVAKSDKLTKINSTIKYTYDSNGYLAASVTKRWIVGESDSVEDREEFTYYSSRSPKNYFLGDLKSRTLSRTVNTNPGGASTWNSKEEYTRDSKGNVISMNLYEGTTSLSKIRETKRTYDSFGNITSEMSSSYGITPFIGKKWTYDKEGINIIAMTDEYGHTTKYSDHDKFGKPHVIEDHSGASNSESYNQMWGFMESHTGSDGSTKTAAIEWGGIGLYTITRTFSDAPTEIEHYDAAGRLVRKEIQLSDSTWTYSDRTYERNGLISCISRPHNSASAEPQTWDMYTYDSYLRPSMILGADGDLSAWQYDGNVIKETVNGIGCTLTRNAAGYVVKAIHPAGRINYDLRADGKPTVVSMNFDGIAKSNMIHKVRFSYDRYGRRSLVKDIRTGNQTDSTIYKTDGTSIKIRKNPNGTVTTTSDIHGNVVKIEREGGDTSEFEYDDCGRLTAAISSNGASTSIYYDALGRLLEQTDNAPDGKWFKKTFSYDAFGNVGAVTYTSQDGVLGTEKRTYANGILHSITFDDNIAVLASEQKYFTCKEAVVKPQIRPWPEEANALLDFLSITYTADGKPASITMEDLEANFTYDGRGKCIVMHVQDNSGVKLNRHYLGGQFEIDVTSDKTIEKLYLGGENVSDSPVVFIRNAKNSSRWLPCMISRDSQGNITSVRDFDGTVYEQQAYDPWGQLANPETGVAYSLDDLPVLMLGRGFHGQEHLHWFALINVEGRIYDPTVGCWITPRNLFFE